MTANRPRIIPVFLPMRACPGRCIFCDQFKITGTMDRESELIKNGISAHIRALPAEEDFELAFYGGTFTSQPVEDIRSWLSWARDLNPHAIRVSTRPDSVPDDMLEMISEYDVRTVELGIQSFDDKVLTASGRGYTSGTAINACRRIRRHHINLGIQLMPGLPADSEQTFMKSVATAVRLRPDVVRIYPTVVFKGTGLEEAFNSGKYKPLTLTDAVKISARAVMEFRRYGITVIRTGLRSLKDHSSVVAGPYHPQFRYMVESRIMLDNLEKILKRMRHGKITITCNPLLLNYLNGFEGSNLRTLKDSGWVAPDIRTDQSMDPDSISINRKTFWLKGTMP